MPVHLGHLDIRNDAVHFFQHLFLSVRRKFIELVPRFLAVFIDDQVGVAGTPQALLDQLGEHLGILRQKDRRRGAVLCLVFIEVGNLNACLRID